MDILAEVGREKQGGRGRRGRERGGKEGSRGRDQKKGRRERRSEYDGINCSTRRYIMI